MALYDSEDIVIDVTDAELDSHEAYYVKSGLSIYCFNERNFDYSWLDSNRVWGRD